MIAIGRMFPNYDAQEIKEHLEKLSPANHCPANSTTDNTPITPPSQISSLGTNSEQVEPSKN